MYVIELDVVVEEQPAGEFVARMAAEVEAQAELVAEQGPAGGWPVVRFTCPTDRSLRKLYLAYEGDDAPIGKAPLAEWVELHRV